MSEAAAPSKNTSGLNGRLVRWLPFLAWFPVQRSVLRGDALAGVTGALVQVPKSMAYASLAGLPVQYGLYASFLPAILGSMWGSSQQLATGPVAVVSLMTAAALTPLAAPNTETFIGLALLLTLMVGVIQFSLGALKLGNIISFISHPVIVGFMNAAAIIIAISQIDLLLGIPRTRSEVFLVDVWNMLSNLSQTHWPTLAMSAFALALLLGMRRIPKLSRVGVLVAVIITIIVSAALEFERNARAKPEHIVDEKTRTLVLEYIDVEEKARERMLRARELAAQLRAIDPADRRGATLLRHQIQLEQIDTSVRSAENAERLRSILGLSFERSRIAADDGAQALYVEDHVNPEDVTDGRRWRIRKVEGGELLLVGGGEVVGRVPAGLPSFGIPAIGTDALPSLLPGALVIALVAFMEGIAMSKALAAKTRQRIDPNQELIGQGVANAGGSLFQSYAVGGSFTGSAINHQAGAKTGMAMVFNGLFVAATLLLLTPLLHHLPKATLGVFILLAITSLFTPLAFRHCWQASRADGMVAATTFVVTLIAAPHLDRGILIGAALAIVLYLYRTVKPRVAQLGRHPDGTLRDVLVYPELRTSTGVVALRFDDSLYFANAAFFEEAVLAAVAAKPQVKYLLIVGSGINHLDASGEEVVRHLVERLRISGVILVFAGLKRQVIEVMRRTGLLDKIGVGFIFPNEDQALVAIYHWLGDEAGRELLPPIYRGVPVSASPLIP